MLEILVVLYFIAVCGLFYLLNRRDVRGSNSENRYLNNSTFTFIGGIFLPTMVSVGISTFNVPIVTNWVDCYGCLLQSSMVEFLCLSI